MPRLPGEDLHERERREPEGRERTSRRAPIGRRDVYPGPLVDGRPAGGALARLRARIGTLLVSAGERDEAELERLLVDLPGVTRPNVVSIVSPKGGVGKTTVTFLVGDLLASRLKLRAVAVDANPDFGTLAALAPDARRNPRSLLELMAARERVATAAELTSFVTRLRSGLHLLAAPADAELMASAGPELYGELLALLGQFYELVLLDLGTGVTAPLARFAIGRSDQLVVVTTPEWITSATVLDSLEHLAHERTTVVLNQARRGAADLGAIESGFRRERVGSAVTIPYDERLRTMLDAGAYALEALERSTRLPIRRLGRAVGERLV
ncbi:MAG: MinD/ParA family ATP-binding protein [Nocardioidaceae bacterium]